MKIPLAVKLRKQAHRDIALAQDSIMEEVYGYFPGSVFHGGTAIWRCYQGNRFSEDLDFYLPGKEKADAFFQALERKGFRILKKRVKENSLYSLLAFNRTEVRFEGIFGKKCKGILKEYEMADGNLFTITTLAAEDLLNEKIADFLARKKVRDLYDIFFLLRHAQGNIPGKLDEVQKAIVEDAAVLPILILSGPIPSVEQMKEYIAQWEKQNT